MSSFKRDEPAGTGHQIKANLKERYGDVLKKDPGEHGVAPLVDTPWFYRAMKQYSAIPMSDFPGLEMRKVDMASYNHQKPPEAYRQVSYYTPIGSIPSTLPNLHACAHLYASDRNSLFVVSNAVGFGDQVGTMGSLSHSVVFHVDSDGLLMGNGQWSCQEALTPWSGSGRGLHESRIWDESGRLVASTWQDGLVRKDENPDGQKQRLGFWEALRKEGKFNESEITFAKEKL